MANLKIQAKNKNGSQWDNLYFKNYIDNIYDTDETPFKIYLSKKSGVNVKDYGAVGNGVTDDTIAIQTAINEGYNKNVTFPSGTYIISSLKILNNITFIFENGAVAKRKAGLDKNQSYWNDGTAIFEVLADGLTVKFTGSPTFDGNKANQPYKRTNSTMEFATSHPIGFTMKYAPINLENKLENNFIFENAVFQNGTAGYLQIRGCQMNREFKTNVYLNNVTMKDTVLGYGSGDPECENTLGYCPDYICISDYVNLVTNNISLIYDGGATPIGSYAPVGIRGTYYGSDYNTSGRCSISLHGKTYVRGIGRKIQNYNGSGNTNNGIGCIDLYGNCESLFCDYIVADNTETVVIRAKSSLSYYTVKSALIKNCYGGLQCGSSSTGTPITEVFISDINCVGGVNPQIDVTGNSVDAKVRSVMIQNCIINGGKNGSGLNTNYASGIFVRYCDEINISNVKVIDQDEHGIDIWNCNKVNIKDSYIYDTKTQSMICSGIYEKLFIDNVSIDGCNMAGLNCNMNDIPSILIQNCTIKNCNDYGIQIYNSGSNNIVRCNIDLITGVSRGIYFNKSGVVEKCSIGTGVTTKYLGTVTPINNEFDPIVIFGTETSLTGRSFNVGDIVYNKSPIASGFVGWICITAGNPATFKTFGVISS